MAMVTTWKPLIFGNGSKFTLRQAEADIKQSNDSFWKIINIFCTECLEQDLPFLMSTSVFSFCHAMSDARFDVQKIFIIAKKEKTKEINVFDVLAMLCYFKKLLCLSLAMLCKQPEWCTFCSHWQTNGNRNWWFPFTENKSPPEMANSFQAASSSPSLLQISAPSRPATMWKTATAGSSKFT